VFGVPPGDVDRSRSGCHIVRCVNLQAIRDLPECPICQSTTSLEYNPAMALRLDDTPRHLEFILRNGDFRDR